MSNKPNPPRTRAGCQNCRVRHLKCDEHRPACTRCDKAGIQCIRGYNIRFKHSVHLSVVDAGKREHSRAEYDFKKSQPWVHPARGLTFLDETQELISIYEPETSYATAPLALTDTTQSAPSPARASESESSILSSIELPLLERVDSTGPAELSEAESPAKKRRLTLTGGYEPSPSPNPSAQPICHSRASSWHASPHTGWTPAALPDIPADSTALDDVAAAAASFTHLEPTVSVGQQSQPALSESLSRVYLNAPLWPLKSKVEAYLLRHFVENLARSFDLTDPLKHFRNLVPQRAASCPTLLNAIFALSARHLSRLGAYDPLVSNKYYQECLKHLIPMLDDITAILDEDLLAATIILRHLEEIEFPVSGQSPPDQSSHLLGAHAFIMAQERDTVAGGLRHAAFWVGLRQEIYVAFVNQRPIIPLEHCNIDRSLGDAPDHVWACRMVVLCADVVCWCFGSDGHSPSDFSSLSESVDQWYAAKPPSFSPIYREDPDGDKVFPELWFVGDEIVTGLHHYHLARILLTSHDPHVPRLGTGRIPALRDMDAEIKDHVRALCGMCLSNTSVLPNFSYASMGATVAGDKFTERREQDALLKVLDMCDKQCALHTATAQENLKLAWGWTDP